MPEDKPSAQYPSYPTNTPAEMPIYTPDVSIAGHSFDDVLKNRGVRFIHERATPCPNILTVDSNAHEPNCPFCDNNGFLHYQPREIWGVFSGNSIQKTFEAHGIWEIGTAVVTFPSTYPDGTPADFTAFDRLYIPDFEVRLWELKEYEPRPGGIQELRYPVVKVDIASSVPDRGNVQKIYVQGVDFTINAQGDIVWDLNRVPSFNPNTGHGEVITWSFYAHPVYLVVQTLRELRITQELVNGVKTARKLPQQVLVRRDFLPTKGESVVNP